MNHIHHVFCTPIMPSIHKRPKGFRVDSKEIPSHRFLEVMQSKWRKREGDSCGIHSGSKMLLSPYKQGGDTFPSVGNLYFSLEGSVSTLAPHQLHLFWQVWSCPQSHLRAVKTSTAVQRASLLQQLGVCVCVGGGVQCITQWAQWHWQSPSWGKSGSTLHRDSQIPKQPAYLCTTPDKSGELFDAALWCQLLHYFYYWHSTG